MTAHAFLLYSSGSREVPGEHDELPQVAPAQGGGRRREEGRERGPHERPSGQLGPDEI